MSYRGDTIDGEYFHPIFLEYPSVLGLLLISQVSRSHKSREGDDECRYVQSSGRPKVKSVSPMPWHHEYRHVEMAL